MVVTMGVEHLHTRLNRVISQSFIKAMLKIPMCTIAVRGSSHLKCPSNKRPTTATQAGVEVEVSGRAHGTVATEATITTIIKLTIISNITRAEQLRANQQT